METEHPAVNVASTSPLVTPSTLAIETNSIMSSSGNGKRSFNGQQSQHGHNDVDREYKIRIVEKLGYMKSALLHDENSSGPNSLGMSSEHHHLGLRSPFIRNSEGMMVDDDDTMKWLEEHELSNLSNVELEQIMDQNIEVVMQQLVQLAVLDEEMKAEIDALDSNGYSLLHYCCMYNLGSLIPVLVSKGAAVNKVTLSGDTPLHLALKGNHIDIIPALLEHGADVYQVLNGDNWTAFDLANMRNQSQALELFAKVREMV